MRKYFLSFPIIIKRIPITIYSVLACIGIGLSFSPLAEIGIGLLSSSIVAFFSDYSHEYRALSEHTSLFERLITSFLVATQQFCNDINTHSDYGRIEFSSDTSYNDLMSQLLEKNPGIVPLFIADIIEICDAATTVNNYLNWSGITLDDDEEEQIYNNISDIASYAQTASSTLRDCMLTSDFNRSSSLVQNFITEYMRPKK